MCSGQFWILVCGCVDFLIRISLRKIHRLNITQIKFRIKKMKFKIKNDQNHFRAHTKKLAQSPKKI